MDAESSLPIVLDRPALELKDIDYGCVSLVLRSAGNCVELGDFNGPDLRRRLSGLLLMDPMLFEALDRQFLGEFDGRRLIASLSSYSHRTLYFWIEGENIGFVVENKDCDFVARGVLYPLDRVQWRRALDRGT
jgi:hypothetical protein